MYSYTLILNDNTVINRYLSVLCELGFNCIVFIMLVYSPICDSTSWMGFNQVALFM